VAIDYRYHIGSFVAVFVALLLGILIGIGLAPNPEEVRTQIADLRQEYQQTRTYREAELEVLKEEKRALNEVARETTAFAMTGRLAGRRVALILGPGLSRELADNLRAALTQAGASVTSTTTITRAFAAMPPSLREKVCKRLLLYPPADAPIRPILAQSIARDLSQGHSKLILALQSSGLLEPSPGSTYTTRVDSVVLVGGKAAENDARPESIDLPLIEELKRLGVRVVAGEESQAEYSCIPAYKGEAVPTIDNLDTLAGRLALVLVLEGASGHYGAKDTADRLLPALTYSYQQ
jgi:hypothetical protein